jgi:hypothetical protein
VVFGLSSGNRVVFAELYAYPDALVAVAFWTMVQKVANEGSVETRTAY